MKARITEEGLLIPKEVVERALGGSVEAEIFEGSDGRLVVALAGDAEGRAGSREGDAPILDLGQNHLRGGVTDASANHDHHLYGRDAGGGGEAEAGMLASDGEWSLDGFVSVLRRHQPEIRERFGVESLGVFGSYARGEQGEGSDLDVLVGFRNTPDLFVFMDLEEYLGELLGVEVELVSRGSLGGKVERRVMGEVVLV